MEEERKMGRWKNGKVRYHVIEGFEFGFRNYGVSLRDWVFVGFAGDEGKNVGLGVLDELISFVGKSCREANVHGGNEFIG